MPTKIRLASGSATRATLLREAHIESIQEHYSFDEEALGIDDPKEFVYRATLGKYHLNLSHFGCEDYPLLVADTVVSVGPILLRKAQNSEDARRILALQSAQEVTITTAMILKAPHLELIDIACTYYRFAPFDPQAIDAYIASGEWEGKAGACMVEGFCRPYITEVIGDESTAMGLNIPILKRFLELL